MTDLTPLVYISGTAASIVAVLTGARSYYARQRKRWTDEGKRSAEFTQALNSNTVGVKSNTEALDQVSRKLERFAEEVRLELRAHDRRIGRLEDLSEVGMVPPSRRRTMRGGAGEEASH